MVFGRTGRPRSRGRVSGDKGEHPRRSRFDNPAECRLREWGATAALGDEGKAVGCVPLTALLSGGELHQNAPRLRPAILHRT
jgi:hypothetical protein